MAGTDAYYLIAWLLGNECPTTRTMKATYLREQRDRRTAIHTYIARQDPAVFVARYRVYETAAQRR